MSEGKAFAEVRQPAPPASVERSLLSAVELFDGLSAAELNVVELSCRYRRFSAHELIVDRDSTTSDVLFVVRGGVRIVNYSLAGREITFTDLGEGQYFGELAALDGRPRSASAVAISDSLIVALPARAFVELLAAKPVVAMRVMLRLAAIIRVADERIMDLSTLGANNRVQAELLRQAHNRAPETNAAVIAPIPIHSDIASRVSTTRETVARVLNDLARQGIVERERDRLLIHDLGRLRRMVDDVRG
jgi:CRP-like cAMP-binding protein